ncbi:MAG TPA: HEAT repeat domain-containing protein [Terriglobia bacterium]|nr:HEAT repeat domain-containing protein [Terriglobia bacterium]
MEKQKFILGEPIFCDFVIRNTGTKTFYFRYRAPDRILNRDLENEPHFMVTGKSKRPLADPAPRRCGGAKGSAVYGSVMLPPGQTHTERWLLNQWARVRRPGNYSVWADRRLPLFVSEPGTSGASSIAAYASALDELQFEVTPASESELRAALEPYVKKLSEPPPADVTEAVLVATTLPQSYFIDQLELLARAPAKEHRWNPNQAVEGLARLGTSAAWQALVEIARGEPDSSGKHATAAPPANHSLRAYAILLLAEKGNAAYLPAILDTMDSASPDLRQDALRSLGFFHSPRAAEVLFEKLRSPNSTDRVNAVLGLKNLGGKNSIPALLDMLKDPTDEVRQVANFALQGLTGQNFKLSASAGRAESARTAKQWHDWWLKNAGAFSPLPQPACRDW